MIFDSIQAEKLYCTYCHAPKPAHIARLHELAADYIKVIAGSLGTDYFEDLCQEGHLKLQRIIIKHQYKPGTSCSMYTFLDKALRNHMIDWLRKTQEHLELFESAAIVSIPEPLYGTVELFTCYYQERFPSLNGAGLIVARYAKDTILERIRKHKALKTITCVYSIPRPQAILMYNSVEILLRVLAVTSPSELDITIPLSCATNGHEFTLYPESVLVDCEFYSYQKLVNHIGGPQISR